MRRISNQSTTELISLFRVFATERREHMLDSSKIANRRYLQMEKIFQEIQHRGNADTNQFNKMFYDMDPNIRLASASKALWKLNEPTAIPVLEEIEKANIQHLSFEARWTLSEWRKRQQGKSA